MRGVLIALIVIAGLLVLSLIADLVKTLFRKPLPDLPRKGLNREGVSVAYRFLTRPETVPPGVVVNETFLADCIQPMVELARQRFDCADFGMLFLYKFYKDCKEKLPASVAQTVKDTFLNFKYWMDEPGDDSMCFWSENHQMMFAVTEYLAGSEWPDEVFVNSGLTGAQHRDKALERIEIWARQRFLYGFSEWYSNNYYPEDIAPISAFIEYASHRDTAQRLAIVFDLLWYDVATHSVNNTFVASSSRMYANNKAGDIYGNSVRDEMKIVWQGATAASLEDEAGESEFTFAGQTFKTKIIGSMQKGFACAVEKGLYRVPDAVVAAGTDTTPCVIRSSSGLSPRDMKEEGLIGQGTAQIMAQFGAETFTNPEVIGNTLRTLSRYKMFRNQFVNPFKYIDISLLRLLKVPAFVSRHLPLMTNGIALGRGNVYFYRNGIYSLSTAVALAVDSCGAQGHIWTANLAPDLTLFTTQPSRDDPGAKKYSESPGYWVGNGRQPMSVQDGSINLTIYKLPVKKRPTEFHIARMTHALAPKHLYDEFILDGGMMFGRKGEALVALRTDGEMHYRPFDADSAKALFRAKAETMEHLPEGENVFDLVREGGQWHCYATELSDTRHENFRDFVARIRANRFECGGGTLRYASGGKEYVVTYAGMFTIDGEPQPLEYERFDGPCAKATRKAPRIEITCGGHSLHLDFDKGLREQKTAVR